MKGGVPKDNVIAMLSQWNPCIVPMPLDHTYFTNAYRTYFTKASRPYLFYQCLWTVPILTMPSDRTYFNNAFRPYLF